MKKKIFNFLYKKALKIISINILTYGNKLTPDYLLKNGWIIKFDTITKKSYYCEPNIKERDTIYIEFESNYYRVWHGKAKTFIALESSIEWFECYYLIISSDRK